MESIYWLMLAGGLTGGFGHCLGMCGPIVAGYSMALGPQAQGSGIWLPNLFYNLGRVTTYIMLGALVGGLGSFAGAAALEPVQKWLMLGSGGVIVVMGLGIAGLPGLRAARLEGGGKTMGAVRKILRVFTGELGAGAFYPMGLILGLLPCGLVYTALITAARAAMETPGPIEGLIKGAVIMALFGLGTMPALLLFGKFAGLLGSRLRGRLYSISGLVMIASGILFILRAI